jgi:TrmH family RNA methyltransferase
MISCILVEPETPGNVGSIARVMQNFGIDGPLILVNPCRLDDEAYMLACNAGSTLDGAVLVDTLADALSLVDTAIATSREAGDEYNVRRIALLPQDIPGEALEGRSVGVIFGRESSGLTNEEIACADLLVTIPTSPSYPTMNISHAAAVVFYEMHKSLMERRRPIKLEGASRGERDMVLADLHGIIRSVEHRPYRIKVAETVFTHVIGRAFLSSREAYTIKGVLRKVLRGLNRDDDAR